MITNVKFAKVHPNAIIPSKREEDMGFDIYACFDEDYIMIKYLLKKENEKPNIWTEYQSYGIGQLKLIEKRFQAVAETLEKSHVEYKYLEIISFATAGTVAGYLSSLSSVAKLAVGK